MIHLSHVIPGRHGRVPGIIAFIGAIFVGLAPSGVNAVPLETTRVEGVIEAIRSPNAVILRTSTGPVTVDLSRLGGVTAAVEQGQPIAAVGVMEPDGHVLHATNLESPASRAVPNSR